MKRLDDVSKIIDTLGGNKRVALLTSVSSNAVSNWRGFGKFPAAVYTIIRDELKRRGYADPVVRDNLDTWDLFSMQKPPPRSRDLEKQIAELSARLAQFEAKQKVK